MSRFLLAFAVLLGGCAGLMGGKEGGDFDKETNATELRIKEDQARSNLAKLEASLADYAKIEKAVPRKLEELVPKYLAEIPPLDLPNCGRETDKVEVYNPDVLRGGQVDGTRIGGTGRWGYVFNERQVVVFVDCLKPSTRGVPWYQERGAY